MNTTAISVLRAPASYYYDTFPIEGKVAIPCYFGDRNEEIRTDTVDVLTSTCTPVDSADEYVEATYSWKTKGYFQVSSVLFLVCLVSFGFGIALSEPRLVASGAVIMSLASASLFVCIRRANKEHDRSH